MKKLKLFVIIVIVGLFAMNVAAKEVRTAKIISASIQFTGERPPLYYLLVVNNRGYAVRVYVSRAAYNRACRAMEGNVKTVKL